jgi:hypothetical protein
MVIEAKTRRFYFRPIGCEESHTAKTNLKQILPEKE